MYQCLENMSYKRFTESPEVVLMSKISVTTVSSSAGVFQLLINSQCHSPVGQPLLNHNFQLFQSHGLTQDFLNSKKQIHTSLNETLRNHLVLVISWHCRRYLNAIWHILWYISKQTGKMILSVDGFGPVVFLLGKMNNHWFQQTVCPFQRLFP